MFRGISWIALRRVARRWLPLASIPLVVALALGVLALRAQPHPMAATVPACSTPDATGAGTCSSPVPSNADTPAATPTDTPATTPTGTPAAPTAAATPTPRATPQPTATPFPSTGESAVLVPCGAASGDNVGASVAITPDGNELVTGAPMTGNRDGAVYILTRTTGAWRQDARLTVADAATGAFGAAVAVSADGGTALVAAPWAGAGKVYVFSRGPVGWTQTAELSAPDSRRSSDQFGYSLSLSADGLTAAISQPRYFSNGSVYVFTRSGSAWSPVATLSAADPTSNDGFGHSLALDAAGTRLVLSDPSHGSADVYDLASGQWTRSSTLASTKATQVAISPDGGTILAGDSDFYATSASVAVFVNTPGYWTSGGTIGKPGQPSGEYGVALSLSADGSRALIGDDGSTTTQGLAYLVESTGGSWSSQQELKNPLPSDYDLYGAAVALDGDGGVASVGAGGFDNTGAVLLFDGTTPNPPQTVHC